MMKHGYYSVFALLLTVLCLFVAPLKAETPRVNSPFYGEVLFSFNQQRFFSAIVQLEKGLSQKQLGEDTAEAQVLLGSLYLAYGLHRSAEQIFNNILETAIDTASRDLAWFYLAKIQFQRGYYQPAFDHLEKISAPLSGRIEDERLTLTALSLMKLNQVDRAIEFLRQQIKGNKNVAYAHFNLAVSLLKRGDRPAAMKLLNELSTRPKQDEESAALSDRVNVLLASQYLKNQQFQLADQNFNRVALHGRFSNQALLGLGWSAFGQQAFATANAAWGELIGRNAADASVLEAYLARAYLLFQLKNYSDALIHYKKAIDVYQLQLDLIDQQLNQTDFSQLMLAMVELETDDEIGWYWQSDVLEGPLLSDFMLKFISGHEFQESLKNYRDLLFITNNLDKWQTSIAVFNDIIDVKTTANAERKPRAERQLKELSEQKKNKAIESLSDRLAAIEQVEDSLALADSSALEKLHQFRSIHYRLGYNLENLEGKLDYVKLVNRAVSLQRKQRLLDGLLKWDLMTSYKIRLREVKKNLADLEREASVSNQFKKNIQEIIRSLPQNYDNHRQRLTAVDQQLKMTTAQVDVLRQQYETYLQSMIRNELSEVKKRIEIYRSQALLAVAHIYDISQEADQ